MSIGPARFKPVIPDSAAVPPDALNANSGPFAPPMSTTKPSDAPVTFTPNSPAWL